MNKKNHSSYRYIFYFPFKRYGNYNRRGNDRGGFNNHTNDNNRPPPAPMHGKTFNFFNLKCEAFETK